MLSRAFFTMTLLGLACVAPAHADFETATTAFRNGEFENAYTEFRILAGQGDPEAQYVLGHMYQLGTGITQNDVEALRWFRAAGERGHRGAQSVLGFIFSSGHGAKNDLLQAYYWFSRAAEQGDLLAREKRDELAASLSVDERENAVKLSNRSPLEGHSAPNIVVSPPGHTQPHREIVPAPMDPSVAVTPPIPPQPEIDSIQIEQRDNIALVPTLPANAGETPARVEPPQPSDGPTVTAQAAPISGAYRVQLGAFRIADNAPSAWQKLRQAQAKSLGDMQHEIRRVEVRNGQYIHLLWVGAFDERKSAEALCQTLMAQGVDCLVVKP